MKTTMHAQKRMAQRGINQNVANYVFLNGTPTQRGKISLGKREALQILEKLEDEKRLLKKILDKGGVVVVVDGDTLITTYNF